MKELACLKKKMEQNGQHAKIDLTGNCPEKNAQNARPAEQETPM